MTVTLADSYIECRRLARRHGTSFFWATRLLPTVTRPHVHALYAFCRLADDIVDEPGSTDPAAALTAFGERFFHDLGRGASDDPVLHAVVHTARSFDLDAHAFRRFLRSMALDLGVDHYRTWESLRAYMDGSAAVIGELLLPLLEPTDPVAARAPARALGEAFQLTNMLRDVGEDLDRGRQYLPQDDLDRFGVDLTSRRCTPAFVELMRFEVARCRQLYRAAEPGVAMLPARSARCVAAAATLYGGILDRIEAQQYDVFGSRARVPRTVKLATVARHVGAR